MDSKIVNEIRWDMGDELEFPRPEGTFIFQNKKLKYLSDHNVMSERLVEIPIASDFIQEHGRGSKMLEVGDVLQRYVGSTLTKLPSEWDVINAFYTHPGIIGHNLFDVQDKYDLIVSVGASNNLPQFTDHPKDQQLDFPLLSIVRIYDLLKQGGRALVTLPFGKPTYMHNFIQFGALYLDLLFCKYKIPRKDVQTLFLKRTKTKSQSLTARPSWVQCTEQELIDVEYNYPFPYANGLCILDIEKSYEALSANPDPYHFESGSTIISGLQASNFRFMGEFDHEGWISANRKGFIFYGPYISVPAGHYRLEADIECKGSRASLDIDIVTNSGNSTLWKKSFHESLTIEADLVLTEVTYNLEIRLFKHTDSSCKVRVPRFLFQSIG